MDASGFDVNRSISEALRKHADMVKRICYLYMRSGHDVDDIFQDVFLKLLQRETPFESEEHEKAWLIRVATNRCKDTLKSFWRSKVDLTEIMEVPGEDPHERELLQAVLALPQKYKDVVYLHYYEGYTVPEMARIMACKENTIYSNLHRARALLKKKLGGNAGEYAL